MDLLKDKGIAPQTDVNSNSVVSIFIGLVGKLSSKIEAPFAHYDFMDLMHDNGFVPEPSNDNVKVSLDVASLFNELFGKLALRFEPSAEHHDFMDLMHDKGFVPAHSNDNDLKVQVA